MNSNRKIKTILILLIFMFAASVIAQTMETNISGLVIKEYNCFEQKWVYGKLINRNNEKFSGKIRIKIIDSENDIMWQGAKQVTVDGMNGTGFAIEIGLGKCIAPNKVQITLER